MHRYTQTHACTLTQASACTHTPCIAHIYIHMRIHTQAHTHTCMHTCAHTHTYAHTHSPTSLTQEEFSASLLPPLSNAYCFVSLLCLSPSLLTIILFELKCIRCSHTSSYPHVNLDGEINTPAPIFYFSNALTVINKGTQVEESQIQVLQRQLICVSPLNKAKPNDSQSLNFFSKTCLRNDFIPHSEREAKMGELFDQY